MAAIRCPDKSLLMDRYNLVQLSSTRTLAMPKEDLAINDAVVYGGIQYDLDTLELMAEAGKYKKPGNDLIAFKSSPRGGTRNGFQYLEGTRKEADIISAEFHRDGIPVKSYSGADALEESFEVLSGNDSPTVIHIATHGFYLPDTLSNSENRELMMLSAIGEERFRLADDPLLRSGLVMAGGNLAWQGKPTPEGLEDGILTAKEVSNMNLLHTQLVVLSACQTGLGDVKGSEGVEGLMRGFKMAGVRYIMMSLWEVPDAETVEIMQHFYENWLGGMEIRTAFQHTQKQMRAKYPEEPYKWAAFVLVE
jgi:CHAT domain-containing protein